MMKKIRKDRINCVNLSNGAECTHAISKYGALFRTQFPRNQMKNHEVKVNSLTSTIEVQFEVVGRRRDFVVRNRRTVLFDDPWDEFGTRQWRQSLWHDPCLVHVDPIHVHCLIRLQKQVRYFTTCASSRWLTKYNVRNNLSRSSICFSSVCWNR